MKYAYLILLVSLGLTISACQRVNDATPASTTTGGKSASESPESHSSIGKPSAPVAVSYRLQAQPVLNQPLLITLTIKPLVPTQSLTLNYTVATGLTPADNTTSFSFAAPVAEQKLTQVITVLPQQEGTMYVNIFVTLQDSAGQMQTKALMIPVSLGNLAKQQPVHPNKAYLHSDRQGNPIITLPAEEPQQ